MPKGLFCNIMGIHPSFALGTLVKKTLTLLLLLAYCTYLQASHIRAGDITARKISALEYEFILTIYIDKNGNAGAVANDQATLKFGDNTSLTVTRTERNDLASYGTYQDTYIFRHTYAAPGRFVASFIESFRNANVLNMDQSGLTDLYIEAQVLIDPLLLTNSLPVLLAPPVEKGNQNSIYTHNPSAYDEDGDSLVFRLTIPKKDSALEVTNYQSPLRFGGRSISGGVATLSIDPQTGLLTWDTPTQPGLYNIAILVEEYRNGLKIGEVTRDMQIEIIDIDNNPPELRIPNDTCIVAGTTLLGEAVATDTPTSSISMSVFSGVLELEKNAASYSYKTGANPQLSPASVLLTWKPGCEQVRNEPYLINFKAEDMPGAFSSLSTNKTWRVTVDGPAISNFQAVAASNSVRLSWALYICKEFVDKIIVKRSDCASDSSSYTPCVTSAQSTNGFSTIAELNPSDTSYIDNNQGKGLSSSALYCYQLMIVYKEPKRGLSIPSEEQCVVLPLRVPVLTRASVVFTDSLLGKVVLAWTPPNALPNTSGPFETQVYRLQGSTNAGSLVYSTTNIADTLYADSLVNTFTNNLRYVLGWVDLSNASVVGYSDTVSTTLLQGVGIRTETRLTWKYNAPWSKAEQKTYIYILSNTGFVLLDSLPPNSTTYVHQGLQTNSTYVYKVAVVGGFTCENGKKLLSLPTETINFSQELKITLTDTLKPCPPTLRLEANNNCEGDLQNRKLQVTLFWTPGTSILCDTALKEFLIYSLSSGGSYSVIDRAVFDSRNTEFSYTHSQQSDTACYQVSVVNAFGLESARSNTVCNVNVCSIFDLPNVFTPNGDGVNDFFESTTVPLGIIALNIEIFNRWGMRIYTSADPKFQWSGDQQPTGVYYYYARITQSSGNISEKKGWIQLIR